ncbi:hypothetical protein ABZX40_33300 [Streptomyces sp. NPDC004610]|uniref:hypothetical protein n=1 Tax=unclassified Streptomyces TaxID=2593676 RepID=UPI0033A7576C
MPTRQQPWRVVALGRTLGRPHDHRLHAPTVPDWRKARVINPAPRPGSGKRPRPGSAARTSPPARRPGSAAGPLTAR